MTSLSLKDITKRYPNGLVAVKELNLEIADKEFIIFVGPSGCGKSMALRMTTDLEDISSGELYIDDKLVNDVESKNRDAAMVFQSYALYPYMSVYDNMALGLKLRETPKDEIDKEVHDAVKILGLEHLLNRKPKIPSGGQKQRVAMGRVTVCNPKMFLVDEPLSNLDIKLRGWMRVEISKFHQRLGTAIIYVTHDQTETMTLGTRVVVVEDGIIQQVDNPWNLCDRPCNKFVAGFIGASQMNVIDATVGKNGVLTTLSLGGHATALSKARSKRLEDTGYIGKVVTLGIRPGNLHGEESYLTMPPKSVFEVTVRVYEMLGSKALLYLDIEDADFITKVDPRTTARPGDTIKLAADLEKIHIFDKDTELVVPNQCKQTAGGN